MLAGVAVSIGVGAAHARQADDGVGMGWHVVRPGDTLEGITARYLGSSKDWKENWKLNEWIRDPDVLLPGARLRVLLKPEASQPAAQVRHVRRSVEEMPTPISWKPAAEDDLLLVRDGLRTNVGATAELAFTDGTSLRVAEDSLVFLGKTRDQRRWNREVEIVHGQTDLATSALVSDGDVEIVLGPAVARARGPKGSGSVRARRPAEGAQLMVFAGSADVAAAGRHVELPAGTGTSVPEKGPPAPPEALLSAPALGAPRQGATIGMRDLSFDWARVPAASSYLVEVCRDAACSDVALRKPDVIDPGVTVASLEPGTYYWRVMARSPSGLDGYAADSAKFTVAAQESALAVATLTAGLTGPEIARAGVRYVPSRVPLEVKADDPGGRLREIQTWVNDQAIGEAELLEPWQGGEYSVSVRARNEAGETVTSAPITFTVDDTPPKVDWQVTEENVIREHGAPMLVIGKVLRDAFRAARIAGSSFSISADGGRWIPADLSSAAPLWRALSMEPQFFILAVDDLPFGHGAPQLQSGQILWVHAADAGSGVGSLEVTVNRPASQARALVVTTTDRVGNAAVESWPLGDSQEPRR